MAKALAAAACPAKGADGDRAPVIKIEFMSCAFLDITTLKCLKELFPRLKDIEVHDCAAFPYHLFTAKPDPPAEHFPDFVVAVSTPTIEEKLGKLHFHRLDFTFYEPPRRGPLGADTKDAWQQWREALPSVACAQPVWDQPEYVLEWPSLLLQLGFHLNHHFNHGFGPSEPARLKHLRAAKEEGQPVFSQGFLRSVCEELKARRATQVEGRAVRWLRL
ncbi:hypothetical protein TI39_contig4381g00003 [Zymoseptoria brevis]|uniref:Uncharacterized protein n=1 Tax=Zymoseptoria brevis TaxID=1047168 RepID=A0A0F4G760_9PEZI|nr:hypothetical protein TI39_contig4381g00003 [Zymoseptoria brevis]